MVYSFVTGRFAKNPFLTGASEKNAPFGSAW